MASITQSILGVQQVTITDEELDIRVLEKLKYAQVSVDADSLTSEVPIQTEDLTEEIVYVDLAEVDLKNTRVIRPVKVRIIAYTDQLSDVEKVEKALYNISATYALSARKISAETMVFAAAVIDQSAEMTNAVKITMDFEQSGRPITSDYNPYNSADNSSSGFTVNTLNKAQQTVDGLWSKVSAGFKVATDKVTSLL
ncbi:hypothetical protein CNR33_00051 [Pseudomonas phage tabernarius]|uniref:Uncharacterized protein n=1 Tax=Pseudomonas phage tabernarius TaxID=2048978 RepID=A0A2H4P6U4_9CAUD|nr:tail fiber protein [Pseudomonas phage tabernarius]ATW57897.1 hypothetical protein CNR33_00051 [Pseudomonas phage tabernarius]